MYAVNLYSSRKIPRRIFPVSNWISGISDYNKTGGSFVWARGIDYRTDPSQLTLLPAGVQEANSSLLLDTVKWAEQVVGRTVIVGNTVNLISNGSFETNTTGWTLGADYTRSNSDSQLGSYSVKQVSTSGTVAFTTANGSDIAVAQYTDYQLIFYTKVTITSGNAPHINIQGGTLTGPSLLPADLVLSDTATAWKQQVITFNSGSYTSVFINIFNNGGNLTAYYDNFSLVQINSVATFAYGNLGNFYKRYSNGAYVKLGNVPNSHGNGMAYYGEDDFVYLMGDTTIGRYGPISSGTPTLVADYFTSQGGVPTNTNSITFIAANSDYANKTTPNGKVNITGDIAIEAFIKPTSLPSVGNSMTIAGVWKETGNLRGWKLDLYGVSGYFGSGVDGALTISVNTTDSPIDSSCSGTSGTNQLNANNGSFATGQRIKILQMQGTGAGTVQDTTIQSYDSTNHIITTVDLLNFSYNSSGSNKAQVVVKKQYSSVTINTGVTLTPKAWNGTTGGYLGFYNSGSLSGAGNIIGTGCGFTGGTGVGPVSSQASGSQGAGTGGAGTNSPSANGNGGGGGFTFVNATHFGAGGGGGGNGTAGTNGQSTSDGTGGTGGNTAGSADLTSMVLGGGGGGGGVPGDNSSVSGAGGNGGAIIDIDTVTWAFTGLVTSAGNAGSNPTGTGGAGGGGTGGSINIKCQSGVFGSNLITALGGAGGAAAGNGGNGGAGGNGRVALAYLNTYSGTTNPTFNVIQDNTLVTIATTQVRLGISNDGTSNEYLTQNLQSITVGAWDRIQVSWKASTSTASFYESGNLIGTTVGAKTAIYGAGAADFAIGANYVGAYANFLDAEVNDVRVWTGTRTQAQFAANNLVNLNGSASGLNGNWFTTAVATDEVSGGNDLTLQGTPTPVYTTDVPFPGATTRLDIDQTGGSTGNTYALPTVLTEAQKQTFIPALDPQKSLQVNIAAKGTGNWTLVVHDGLNRVVAQVTVLNANLMTGQYEFIYPAVFSPVVGATYHFHEYSSVNDGTVVSTTANTASTIQFTTYYQFLLNDYDYHPGMQMVNVLGIGNGRYLAVQDAAGVYNSRRLRFPSGWRVRALAKWRGYYAIGCWKGTTIKDFDQGIVFLWDGYSITYNDFFDVPQGGINAMFGENGTLYIIAGYKGDLLEYTGGDSAKRVKRIPRIGKNNYMEVLPGAMTYWQGLLRIGVGYNSDSTTLEKGVYTWGSLIDTDPKSLSFDYPISTGNRFTTVSMGALVPTGSSLLSFYQDNISNGVDNINTGNPCQTNGTIEQLISDLGFYWKEKELLNVRADFLPLLTGQNIDVKYKINYESSWHNRGVTTQAIGDFNARYPLPSTNTSRWNALQIAMDITSTTGISPTILEQGEDVDILLTETDENSNGNPD